MEEWAKGIEWGQRTQEQVRALSLLAQAAVEGHSLGLSSTDRHILQSVLTEQIGYGEGDGDSGIVARADALKRVLKGVSAKSCDRISQIDLAAIVFLINEYANYAVQDIEGFSDLLRRCSEQVEEWAVDPNPQWKEG